MKKLFLIVLFLSVSLGIFAQSAPDYSAYPYWIEMMQDKNANFYEVQKAFNMYWENREVTKGCGWKPFKRWEYMQQFHIDVNGNPIADNVAWEAYFDFQEKYGKSVAGNWQEVGPIALPDNATGQPNGTGRLNAVAFHPTDENIIYVGAPAGGLWKTEDGGLTWYTLTDMLPSLGVSSIIIHPQNPERIYIGTGDRDAGDSDGIGVLVSNDGGNSWQELNAGIESKTVGMMVMHPDNDNLLIIATNGGIYKTINGGESWSMVSSGSYRDIRFHPTNPEIVYAENNGDFYRSSNGGSSWTQVTTGLGSADRLVIGVTPANPDVVYCFLTSNYGNPFVGIYRSDDAGLTFVKKSPAGAPNILGYSELGDDNNSQAWYDLCIAVSQEDENTVFFGGVNIWKTTDAGSNLEIVTHWVGSGSIPGVHADQHILEFSPLNGDLYVGNDGGFYKSENTQNWTNLSSGIAVAQIYCIGQSATDRELTINGYQDNGSAVCNGLDFTTVRGGDGMECLIDYSDATYRYASVYFGSIGRSTGGWYNEIAGDGINGITESGGWVTPYALDVEDPNTMYIGMKNIWRSVNVKTNNSSSVVWTKISNGIGVNYYDIENLEQSPANPEIMYVSKGSTLVRTDNLSATTPTWQPITSMGSVADIIPHPTNENIVYAIFSGTVYKSTNKGSTWTSINGNLPSVSKYTLVYDKNSEEGIYVGTSAGVFYKEASMNEWITYSNNQPAVKVTELEIYYDENNPARNRLKAATYGRGLWQSDLYDDGMNAPVADFIVDNTVICKNGTVNFSDQSAYEPTTWQWSFSPATVEFMNNTSASSQNPLVKFTEAGVYDVTLSVENTYGNNSTTATELITAHEPAISDFTYIANNLVVSFADASQNSNGSGSWTFGDGTSASGSSPTHTYSGVGTYEVSYTVSNNYCGEDESQQSISVVNVGINNNINRNEITVSPNPNNGVFDVVFKNDFIGNITISIFDIYGKQLYLNSFNKNSNTFDISIENKNLVAGIYNLKIVAGNNIFYQQIVVQ